MKYEFKGNIKIRLNETCYKKKIILNINTNLLFFLLILMNLIFDLKKLDYNCSKENNFYSLTKIEYRSFLDQIC